jgi:PAS domain S-box-containing protein
MPTAVTLVVAELLTEYTGSGYSVVVITLLSVLLYTAYRYGTVLGLISALLIVLYNFYAVAQNMNIELFSMATLSSGGVIATVFPVLAFIISRLKARNDMLLRRAEEARLMAEESARQLNFMAESMPQKIFTTLPNGKSVYMNAQWAGYTGSSKKAMSDWGRIVHPHDAKENMRVWKQSLETGEPFQFEHRLRRADGQYIWHLTRAQPLRDKRGKITLWIGSTTDIEDVRRARKLEANTARLMRQRTELMELNKAKDEFISLASHQLRTPATGVKQYINMAMDGYAGKVSPKLRDFLEKANNSNERQLSIINELLRVAHIDAGKVVLRKEPVNVERMVASILRDQRSMFEGREQRIDHSAKRAKVMAMADPTKLRMVLENVIDNASKYSLAETTIGVKVTKYRGQVRIAVIDQGVGIAKEDQDKVFEKFMRLDNPLSTIVGGNGLGLYWVKKVVELHGGTITVAPNPSGGSIFTIALPASGK